MRLLEHFSSWRVTMVRIARRSTGGVVMIDMSRRPEHGHLQGARDRRRREREHVDARLEGLDALLVGDAEALLLVDDQQAEPLEVHVLREQAVGADHDVDGADLRPADHLVLLRLRLEPATSRGP
jgi:hypothetical protein